MRQSPGPSATLLLSIAASVQEMFLEHLIPIISLAWNQLCWGDHWLPLPNALNVSVNVYVAGPPTIRYFSPT